MLPADHQENCRLVMAGRVNDVSFRKEVEKLANNNPSIVFRDELDHVEVARHIFSADIVIVPSRDDPLPLTSLEALSAGKILVCSGTTGTSEYIADGESGFMLVENGPEDICATLCRALAQKSRWPQIGAKARELYESHFTQDRFKARLFRALGLA